MFLQPYHMTQVQYVVGRAHWLRAEGGVSDRSKNNKERMTEGEATLGARRGTSSGTARINTHTTHKNEELI